MSDLTITDPKNFGSQRVLERIGGVNPVEGCIHFGVTVDGRGARGGQGNARHILERRGNQRPPGRIAGDDGLEVRLRTGGKEVCVGVHIARRGISSAGTVATRCAARLR